MGTRGYDGSFYNDSNERIKADNLWLQKERQNKLLKEQNDLIKKQNKLKEKELNNINNHSSSSNLPLTEFEEKMFDSIGLGDSVLNTNPEVSKLNDIKFAIFMNTFGIIILFFIAWAGVVDSFLYYCLRIGTGDTNNTIGLGIFAIYLLYYIYLIIKKRKFKKLVNKMSIENETQKQKSSKENIEREYSKPIKDGEKSNGEDEKMEKDENLYFTVLDIDKFCTKYNENLKRYYDFYGKDIEHEQLESTEISSYSVNKDDFYLTSDENELNLKFYTAIKNDIKISLLCNENQIVVSASISNTEDIDYISNELIKRIYLPFLSTITAKNIEDSINTWRSIIDTDDWKINEDEFSYSLMDDYLFMITNLILINFMDREEE